MPQEPENKDEWRPLSNPKFARGVLWVTLGIGAWFILMLFAQEMSLGTDRHSAWLGMILFGPLVVVFVAVAFGFTLAIPKRFPVARSTVSVVFLLIALFYTAVLTWSVLLGS